MKEIFAIIKETRYYPRQWWIRHVDEKHAFIFILHLLRAGVKDVLFFLRFFYATLDCHFVPQRKFNYPIPDSKGHRGSRGASKRKKQRRKFRKPVASTILLDVTVPLCERKKE